MGYLGRTPWPPQPIFTKRRSRRLIENLGGRALREFEEYGALQVQFQLGREDA